MGQSYRIRTELGVEKTINVDLQQDFEFLEILSLKIQQADIYTRNCADYGVIVGRVTANNGTGVPNAKISVFIPIQDADQSNSIITSLYPYRNPLDKNEDGYRYNLLPYEKSYSKHAATGTFPSRTDVISDTTVIEIFEKYYKYTVKTNDSGDYMIMGAPLGSQTLVMDLDLSDIGEFSLTPQDLIRMNLASPAQVAGNTFRSSNDLDSLPQIVSITKSLEVSPLWGDPDLCQIAINRVDFDLRDDANIDIQPTSVFMGSMFSTIDKYRVRKNCKPKDNMGNLCDLTSGPGQVLAIRQTIRQDTQGYPILEEYKLEQSGNVIDESGTWLCELPMNLDYVVTNEFGEKVISNNPRIGIPTKGKYRFKIKWQQPNDLTIQTRRPYFLVPNVREYGWSGNTDPNTSSVSAQAKKELKGSYYFGLDWSGYTNQNAAVNCEDTFYEFKFNKVYTVAGLIDQYKKGDRGRFIGIKEVDDDSCNDIINKFPVNEGFRNFDFLFFIFSILFYIVQTVGIVLLIVAHIILAAYAIIVFALCRLCSIKIPIINVRPFGFICNALRLKCTALDFTVKLPMITYPDCSACECEPTKVSNTPTNGGNSGVLSYLSFPDYYYNGFQRYFSGTTTTPNEDADIWASIYSQSIAGNNSNRTSAFVFKAPKSDVQRQPTDNNRVFTQTFDLPFGERINIFNTRDSYFDNKNKIRVTFAKDGNNGKFHTDNTITVLSNTTYPSGQLLTTVNPFTSTDLNFNFSAATNDGIVYGIEGVPQTSSFNHTVSYAVSQTTEQTVTYSLPTGTTINRQIFPMDREYFQVVTAITVADAIKIWNPSEKQTFANILDSTTIIRRWRHRDFPLLGYASRGDIQVKPRTLFEGFEEQYILILQRGVDPYSPKYINEYSVGKIFGSSETDTNFTFTAETRINVPIQKRNSGALSVQNFVTNQIFYPSPFFQPGSNFSAFTSSTIAFYSKLDANFSNSYSPFGQILTDQQINGVSATRSKSSNEFYSNTIDEPRKYDSAEDLSGGSYIYGDGPAAISVSPYNAFRYLYLTPNLYPDFIANPMNITNKVTNIMRTDRLPSSDVLDGDSWTNNPSLLQQNNNFNFYTIPDPEDSALVPGYTAGADQVSPDLGDQPLEGKVLASFNCEGMVGLKCYNGNGQNFGVKPDCEKTDYVDKGCYIFLKRPLLDLIKDIGNYSEWAYRFRFFYAICRGVLSQTFTNNWVNGTLFAFPIQVDTKIDRNNQYNAQWCKDLIYYETTTNNFYYRSSPYNQSQKKFVGKPKAPGQGMVNERNLLFPTTIVDLGMKDSFWYEITLNPEAKGFIMNQLSPTSFGDTSDLVNLFVISRITDASFLGRLFAAGDNSINQLFSRDNQGFLNNARRVDGDFAQLISINSEIANIKFSPEYYESTGVPGDPIVIVGNLNNPVMGVFFSSTTENLQTKDYLTPGRINFRPAANAKAFGYNYGIKSQRVPFYQWGLRNSTTIFGNDLNNWRTSESDIFSREYQSLDRTGTTIPSYFISSNAQINDTYARGYIFDVDVNGNYSIYGGNWSSKFLVGAPFHFYFGINIGATALEKFKSKYLSDE